VSSSARRARPRLDWRAQSGEIAAVKGDATGNEMERSAGPRVGVLLVNLGTPDAPTRRDVARYLRQFLTDGRVIDIPAPARWLLVNGIIAPFRAGKSAHAYQQVWTAEGSPLLMHSQALERALAARLAPTPVVLAMRYGQPCIERGLEKLMELGVERIVVAPLYPQYASSSTGTVLEDVYSRAAKRWNTPYIAVLPPFYAEPAYLDASAHIARPHLDRFGPDRVLFSFHGLPARHVRRSDESGGSHCLVSKDCCARIVAANRNCYRAQCYATARELARRLALPEGAWDVAFQSRLGKGWIEPFTDVMLPAWAKAGARRVAVLCPAFVADCLETLEEIGMRARDDFRAAGGEELMLVPSLNAEPEWVEALAALLAPVLA